MTATATTTLKKALNLANPGNLADLLRKVALGDYMDPIEETVTLGAVSATVDLTVSTAAKKAARAIERLDVTDVTGGTLASVGICLLTAATPKTVVAGEVYSFNLSADGKTITFSGTVKAFKIKYYPVPATSLSAEHPMV